MLVFFFFHGFLDFLVFLSLIEYFIGIVVITSLNIVWVKLFARISISEIQEIVTPFWLLLHRPLAAALSLSATQPDSLFKCHTSLRYLKDHNKKKKVEKGT